MFDTQDAEFGVQLAGCAYRAIRRECSDIKALGTRVGCGGMKEWLRRMTQ